MVQNGPPYLSLKKNSGGQQEEGPGIVHHLQQEHYCQAQVSKTQSLQSLQNPKTPRPSLRIDLIDSQSGFLF